MKKIVEKKIENFNQKYKCKTDYIDSKALEFATKKVCKISGDIRVVFDLIKTALTHLTIQYRQEACEQKDKLSSTNSTHSIELEEEKKAK